MMKSFTALALVSGLAVARAATINVAAGEDFEAVCLHKVQPGDTCVLEGGDYLHDGLTVTHGTADLPITITGDSSACIKGSNTQDRVLQIAHDYYIIDGICFDGDHNGEYVSTAVYVLGADTKSEKNGVMSSVTGLQMLNLEIRNFGSECVHFRYFVSHAEVYGCTFQSCGVDAFVNGGGGKVGEAVYMGTALDQVNDGKAPEPKLRSGSADSIDVDECSHNKIHFNTIRTYGNECVDIKEGSHSNIIEENICEFQKDENSGGIGIRGSFNTARYNEISNCDGAAVRVGGDKGYGEGNHIYGNKISEIGYGAFNLMATGHGTICGNSVSGATLAVGSYKDDLDAAEAIGDCVTTPGDYDHFDFFPSRSATPRSEGTTPSDGEEEQADDNTTDGGDDNTTGGTDGGDDNTTGGTDGGDDNTTGGTDGGATDGTDGGDENTTDGTDGGDDNTTDGTDGGDDNTGDDHTGDDHTGDDNTGDDHTGDDNTGDDNTGDDNTGDDNTGDDNTDGHEVETNQVADDVQSETGVNGAAEESPVMAQEVQTNAIGVTGDEGECATVLGVSKVEVEHSIYVDGTTDMENLFDGNLESYFSVHRESTTVTFELDAESTIEGVSIGFYLKGSEDRVQTFDVLVKDGTATDWTTAISGEESSGGGSMHNYVFTSPHQALYVQFKSRGNTFNNWTALTEFHVCGSDTAETNALFGGARAVGQELQELAGGVCTTPGKLTPRKVRASGNDNVNALFDGNFETRWTTLETYQENDLMNGQINMHFIGDQNVAWVKIAFFDGSLARQHFSIYKQSAAESSWTPVLESQLAERTASFQTFHIQATGVNRLYVVGHGNDVGHYTKISEIEVYGC